MEKKEWKAPELIVLVRNKPEEAVLANCKNHIVGGGPSAVNNGCDVTCTFCFAEAGS